MPTPTGTRKVNHSDISGMIYIMSFMLAPAWPMLGLFFIEMMEDSSAVAADSTGMSTSQFHPPCQGRLGVPLRSSPRKFMLRD